MSRLVRRYELEFHGGERILPLRRFVNFLIQGGADPPEDDDSSDTSGTDSDYKSISDSDSSSDNDMSSNSDSSDSSSDDMTPEEKQAALAKMNALRARQVAAEVTARQAADAAAAEASPMYTLVFASGQKIARVPRGNITLNDGAFTPESVTYLEQLIRDEWDPTWYHIVLTPPNDRAEIIVMGRRLTADETTAKLRALGAEEVDVYHGRDLTEVRIVSNSPWDLGMLIGYYNNQPLSISIAGTDDDEWREGYNDLLPTRMWDFDDLAHTGRFQTSPLADVITHLILSQVGLKSNITLPNLKWLELSDMMLKNAVTVSTPKLTHIVLDSNYYTEHDIVFRNIHTIELIRIGRHARVRFENVSSSLSAYSDLSSININQPELTIPLVKNLAVDCMFINLPPETANVTTRIEMKVSSRPGNLHEFENVNIWKNTDRRSYKYPYNITIVPKGDVIKKPPANP